MFKLRLLFLLGCLIVNASLTDESIACDSNKKSGKEHKMLISEHKIKSEAESVGGDHKNAANKKHEHKTSEKPV